MRSRVGVTVLVALLVVAGFDLFVRARADRLEAPLEYHDALAQDRVRAMEELAAAGVTSDLAIVGTSMVGSDVRVPILKQRLDGLDTIHDIPLPGGRISTIRRWTLEEVVPRLRPRRILWGISSHEFSPHPGNEPEYSKARETRPGTLGELDRVLGMLSALSRHRVELRNPMAWRALIFGEPTERHGVRSPLAQGNASASRTVRPRGLRLVAEVLAPFTVDNDANGLFLETVDELQSRGIEIVIVWMPVSPEYLQSHPGGDRQFLDFQAHLTALLEARGIPVLDHSHSHPGSDFADLTHLQAAPAQRFTGELADELARLGW